MGLLTEIRLKTPCPGTLPVPQIGRPASLIPARSRTEPSTTAPATPSILWRQAMPSPKQAPRPGRVSTSRITAMIGLGVASRVS